MQLNLADVHATEVLGLALARAFPGACSGAVVYLEGELGAGKTACARSILHSLGVTGPVRSPTYTLVETYSLAGLECVHVDLYRIEFETDIEALGLCEMTGPGHLMLIEWPGHGGALIPPADLMLTLSYAGIGRTARLEGGSLEGRAWLDNLARDRSLNSYVSNLT